MTAHQNPSGIEVKLVPFSPFSVKNIALENRTIPMKTKKTRRKSSLTEACNVRPRILRPLECLDNLNILRTRTSLITLRMLRVPVAESVFCERQVLVKS
jgi:hypothetical protein